MSRLLLACAVIAISAGPVSAQYFGQNKVSYETFDFQVLRTAHFDIYHYPAEAEAVALAARLAEQWRTRLADVLGFDLPGRQPLVLYASQPHFQQTQVIGGLIGEGTGGVTESLKRRMVLPFAGSLGETSHVLGHEMVHAFQYAAAGERFGALPLWFIEGMAEYLSLGPDDAPTAAWLRDLAAGEEIPAIRDLNDPRYFPYRAGHALWAFLASRYGRSIVGSAYLAGALSPDGRWIAYRRNAASSRSISRSRRHRPAASCGASPPATPTPISSVCSSWNRPEPGTRRASASPTRR